MTNAISGISLETALGDSIKANAKSRVISTTSNTSTTNTSTQTKINNAQNEIDNASELQTKNDKTIEELEKEVETLQAQIVENMEKALNEGEDFTDEQQTNINNAVTQTVAAYLNGEISKDELMKTMATKLSASDSEMGSKLSELIDGNDSIVDKIDSKISQICDLASQNDELAAKIKSKAADIESLQAESTDESKCCDPIGFEQDGATYDFIVDRDNDGEFDGQNEFLGAENGFDEMKALDADGNGIVEGDELKGVQMIKTDKATNTQSFVTAQEAGVTSIDLSTYKAKNEKMANGNTLAGNYNVNVNGKEVEGYQTLDKTDWLTQNYGNMYGKSMTSDATYSTESTATETAVNSVKETQSLSNAAAAAQNHTSLKDVKNLKETDTEALLDETTVTLDDSINATMLNNATSVADSTNNLMPETEKDTQSGNKEEKTDKEQTQQKPTTQTFMAMAYATQAQDANAKKKIAA